MLRGKTVSVLWLLAVVAFLLVCIFVLPGWLRLPYLLSVYSFAAVFGLSWYIDEKESSSLERYPLPPPGLILLKAAMYVAAVGTAVWGVWTAPPPKEVATGPLHLPPIWKELGLIAFHLAGVAAVGGTVLGAGIRFIDSVRRDKKKALNPPLVFPGDDVFGVFTQKEEQPEPMETWEFLVYPAGIGYVIFVVVQFL